MNKIICASTMVSEEEMNLLVKAFGAGGLAHMVDERLDTKVIEPMLDEARRFIAANPKLFPEEFTEE